MTKIDGGLYLLAIEMEEPQVISVGKHSPRRFEKGFYFYISRARNGFGSSDCLCPGHLVYNPAPNPNLRLVIKKLLFQKVGINDHYA